MMEANKYQELAMRTLNKDIKKEDILINASMGLCGESGEVVDLVKKHLFQGHDLDKEKIIKELGDVAWYLAESCVALDISLDEVLEKNIKKLKERFPNGFESEKSIKRNEGNM